MKDLDEVTLHTGHICKIDSVVGAGWDSNVYTDEVIHSRSSGGADDAFISEFPFIEGFFIATLYRGSSTTKPVAGPFPTIEAAAAAWRLFK